MNRTKQKDAMTCYTILLSAEQAQETGRQPWIMNASAQEIASVKEQNPSKNFLRLEIDSTGRPYLWKTIDGSICPDDVLAKVETNLRVFRW
jgi:hypothetical protein